MCTEIIPAPQRFVKCRHTVDIPEGCRNIMECDGALLHGTQCERQSKGSQASCGLHVPVPSLGRQRRLLPIDGKSFIQRTLDIACEQYAVPCRLDAFGHARIVLKPFVDLSLAFEVSAAYSVVVIGLDTSIRTHDCKEVRNLRHTMASHADDDAIGTISDQSKASNAIGCR